MCSNYRPISLLPVIRIVMESIINQNIIKYFEINQIIYNRHYGCRHKRSTSLELINNQSHSNDLDKIINWTARNPVHFTALKIHSRSVHDYEKHRKQEIFQSCGSNLSWKKKVVTVTAFEARILFRVKKYIYISQVRRNLEYYAHYSLHSTFRRKQLNSSVNQLSSLSSRRSVTVFYRYIHGFGFPSNSTWHQQYPVDQQWVH